MFLNKILDDGVVPQALNIGKCMLIHKVIFSPNKYNYWTKEIF